MTELNLPVQFFTIDDGAEGQRIDNYLITKLKGVPKTRIYRLLRKGEVRVNKKRIKPEYKLQLEDIVRVPPIRMSEANDLPSANLSSISRLEAAMLYEDDALILLNKPSGMAVHGGSGLSFGVIEGLRALRPDARFLELVHRIDRDTSGCLLIAKKRSALRHMHEQLRVKTMHKQYLALVAGVWPEKVKLVNAPLLKNEVNSIVRVHPDGKSAETRFKIVRRFEEATLLECSPITGRTHQIRVHAQYVGHPIAQDERYGNADFDEVMRRQGLSRLFLHAWKLRFTHPISGEQMQFEAPLDAVLEKTLTKLKPV